MCYAPMPPAISTLAAIEKRKKQVNDVAAKITADKKKKDNPYRMTLDTPKRSYAIPIILLVLIISWLIQRLIQS